MSSKNISGIGGYMGGAGNIGGVYSSTSSFIANNYTQPDNYSNYSNNNTRAAAKRNLNYGINTPLLYDMQSPINYNQQNYLDYYSINNYKNPYQHTNSTRRRASTLAEAWIELYQAQHGGAMPSDEELEDFIDWWLGQGFLAPSVDPDPDPDPGIPGLYESWLEMFRAEMERDPVSLSELEDYIKWKMGEGPFSPYEDLPTGELPLVMMLLLSACYCIKRKIKTTHTNKT